MTCRSWGREFHQWAALKRKSSVYTNLGDTLVAYIWCHPNCSGGCKAIDNTDDSSDKDIYIELNIPVVTNGDYGSVKLHDHTSVNLYTNKQLSFPPSSVIMINSDTNEDPRQQKE